ncbi:Zn-ribbon containing protein [Candidatus Gugararchaeum adminiculabundum]|nr:Zn-ribbon containing protein [Candidatus Gugararchaeum adminiculabundum]
MPHKCIRCNAVFEDSGCIESGCPCGSRVFVFFKDGSGEPEESEKVQQELEELQQEISSDTKFEVENVKVLKKGVFGLDLNSLTENPVVLKDEKEIYYIKLPNVKKLKKK